MFLMYKQIFMYERLCMSRLLIIFLLFLNIPYALAVTFEDTLKLARSG
jgi:hypothetical protein